MPWSCDKVVESPAPVGTADGAPASEEDDGAAPFDGAAAMGATATRCCFLGVDAAADQD